VNIDSIDGPVSGNFRARLDGFLRRQYNHSAFVGNGEKHSLTFQAAQLGGFQVGDHNDLPAHKFLRGVVVPYARAYLALLGAEIDLQDHELVGIGMKLGGFNRCHSEFYVSKFINRYHAVLALQHALSLEEDSRTYRSKKDFDTSRVELKQGRKASIVWTTLSNEARSLSPMRAPFPVADDGRRWFLDKLDISR
jgi:hypothetical protein